MTLKVYGLTELANGFQQCSSIEYLDLQCNDLNDSHGWTLSKIISTQFEMRDNLQWKLGLRLPQEIDVSKLGIRYLHLARNSISNKGAIQLAMALKQDAYIRAVNLQRNKVGEAGMMELLSACHFNTNLLLMDVTQNNPIYEKKRLDLVFRKELLKNLKLTIQSYVERAGSRDLKKPERSFSAFKGPSSFKQSRINFEWMIPELFGVKLKGSRNESNNRSSSIGRDAKVNKKAQFIQFATQIAHKLQVQYADVVRAFIGDGYQQIIGRLRYSSSAGTHTNSLYHNTSHQSVPKSGKSSSLKKLISPQSAHREYMMDEAGDVNLSVTPLPIDSPMKKTIESGQRVQQQPPRGRSYTKQPSKISSSSEVGEFQSRRGSQPRSTPSVNFNTAGAAIRKSDGNKKRIQSAQPISRGDVSRTLSPSNNDANSKKSSSMKKSFNIQTKAAMGDQVQMVQSTQNKRAKGFSNKDMASYIKELERENNHLKNLMAQRTAAKVQRAPHQTPESDINDFSHGGLMEELMQLQQMQMQGMQYSQHQQQPQIQRQVPQIKTVKPILDLKMQKFSQNPDLEIIDISVPSQTNSNNVKNSNVKQYQFQ